MFAAKEVVRVVAEDDIHLDHAEVRLRDAQIMMVDGTADWLQTVADLRLYVATALRPSAVQPMWAHSFSHN